ncbi:MAG: hypothetical protein EOO52_11935 [Gammaproteobacteria bacterium]|nr:MAG: hypothetical protein EOO52_11935 [Gammaproteobacteria bacterium]
MRKYLLFLMGLLGLQTSGAMAADLDLNVLLSGEVRPGVYGQVQIGNAPRPAVVYERPRVVVVDRHYEHEAPVYLHVPPGHARHWDRHCHDYHACSRRVYFVRSEEYEPTYVRVHEHEPPPPRHHHRDRGPGHGPHHHDRRH